MRGIALCLLLSWGPAVAQNHALPPWPRSLHDPEVPWYVPAITAIEGGDFAGARRLLTPHLATPGIVGWVARWEMEKMRRIELDFPHSPEAMLAALRRRLPGVDRKRMLAWHRKGTLRGMTIDGRVRYFGRALHSLLLLEPEARPAAGRTGRDATAPEVSTALRLARRNLAAGAGGRHVAPVRLRVEYKATVKEGAVPPGGRIRCWLPYPRPSARQREIHLVATTPASHQIAPPTAGQRTVYLERTMPKRGGCPFAVTFTYLAYASVVDLRPDKARTLNAKERTGALAPWLRQRYPHEFFLPEILALAARLQHKNPVVTARRVFAWMQDNIPWAPAREYSTIRCIPELTLKQRHGDCGMQALLMISLLRACGIPARWQSGWSVRPGDPGMHDWLRLYIAPWGWVHADPSRGWVQGGKERERWFNLGSLDQYRLTVCDDWGCRLHPAKVHYRAEPVDFQRGELEWEGGGLYFKDFTRRMTVTRVEE